MRFFSMGMGSLLLLGAAAAPAAASDAVFREMDRDGNRMLTAAEHVTGSRALFDRMDADRSDSVTADEIRASFQAITGREPGPGDLSAEEQIASIDKDRDGKLSAKEHAAGARKEFDRMDADRNGTLSEAEYAVAQALKKKKKR